MRRSFQIFDLMKTAENFLYKIYETRQKGIWDFSIFPFLDNQENSLIIENFPMKNPRKLKTSLGRFHPK